MSKKYDLDLTMPWSRSKAINYVLALTMEGLMSSTVKTYLSRVRTLHKARGLSPGWETDDLKFLMKGVCNLPRRDTPKRLAITPSLLQELCSKIRNSNMSALDKGAVWAACALLYCGALRSCEVLSPSASSFDPSTTLRRKDIRLVTEQVSGKTVTYLKMIVKNPKEFRAVGSVEVFWDLSVQITVL